MGERPRLVNAFRNQMLSIIPWSAVSRAVGAEYPSSKSVYFSASDYRCREIVDALLWIVGRVDPFQDLEAGGSLDNLLRHNRMSPLPIQNYRRFVDVIFNRQLPCKIRSSHRTELRRRIG